MYRLLAQTGLVAVCCLLTVRTSAQDPDLDSFREQNLLLQSLADRQDELLSEFRVADIERREVIRENLRSLQVEMETMLVALRGQAIGLYRQSPNEHDDVALMLLRLAATDIGSDNYPSAMELIELLTANENSHPALYNLAGEAAFGANSFEQAREFWNRAAEEGTLAEQNSPMLATIDSTIEAWNRELEFRRSEAASDDLPRVRVETNRGVIIVELFENEAPGAVGNFISLVESGYYDGLTFHRVLPGFMAQGGCPEGTGRGGPGYNIYCECDRDDYRQHFAGTLSMAHAGRDTGGSQFFLTFVPTPHLDGRHTAFGRVIEGWEVLSLIQRIDPARPGPEPDRIVSATVIRKRDHLYEPNKVE